MTMIERLAWLRQRVKDQRDWIERHGGDLAGYIRHYGDQGIAPCDENGNAMTITCPPELAEECGLRPVGPDAPGCYYKEHFGGGGTLIYEADKMRLDGLERELAELEPRYGRYMPDRTSLLDEDGRYRGPTSGLTAELLLADMQARINQTIVRSGGSQELRELRDILHLGRRILGLAVPTLYKDEALEDRPWSE